VSVVSGGRPLLRSIKVMGRPTAIRSIDSWVVGIGGGSIVRLGRRGVSGVGPRSAHGAGLRYACFADPADLAGCELTLVAPRPGDPEDHVVVEGPGGRFAVTVTCAANAVDAVREGAHAAGSREAAQLAFEAIAKHRRGDGQTLAQAALDKAIDQIEGTVADATRSSGLGDDAVVIALGGAGEPLAAQLCERTGREMLSPRHPEVLASVGAAMTLIRVELERSARALSPEDRRRLVHDAELACVDAGAAPGTISVETAYDLEAGMLRAVAVGSVALEAGAAGRESTSDAERRQIAAASLAVEANTLTAISETEFFSTFVASEDGEPRLGAIVDRLGGVIYAGGIRSVAQGAGEAFLAELEAGVDASSVNLGLGSLLPQVTLCCGARVLDLTDSRTRDDLLGAARLAVEEAGAPAVALIRR
jgi:N-methylhydantoinase A/oxoprolinase/acetone carboxylase beta subunit